MRLLCLCLFLCWFCPPPTSRALSVRELQDGIPLVSSFRSGTQHFFLIKVSDQQGRPSPVSNALATKKLSVRVETKLQGVVLALCHDQLPCGGIECSCPRKLLDAGDSEDKFDTERSVEVSPCDLLRGSWYISVEIPAAAASIAGSQEFSVVAKLSDGLVRVGATVKERVCCMQSKVLWVQISEPRRGHELRVKLLTDDRVRTQSPLVLSVSYNGCDGDGRTLGASMGSVLTLPPDEVHEGRLCIRVRAVNRNGAEFTLSVSYRPELKWTVVAFLASTLVLVAGTFAVVCFIKVRRRFHKYRIFADEVKDRKRSLKMAVRDKESPDEPPGMRRFTLVDSDSSDSGEEVELVRGVNA